ncbi:IS701 family transposase [Streptomyces sp. NBC_00078]|uniref:IS701 family transposase n=1 Tax=unclassified Streptomyces TaxID=2593676 RepID=UPI002252F34E|nr:IS701 family transposase [Streptomyces sp. NBC_00078]MCX5420903.1 IS701 family transposase [Streptomyces sp. NBC_00078]MCX5422187.1 IS701 family transposase [Streptomyces sp. NBC_00078]MCX5425565.1 IS701 family transposase [Streptomyces sp. NBC_00078]
MGLRLPLGVVRTDELTEGQVRELEGELEALCASVDDVFARPASRENLRAMVRGLLSEVPRKNLWQLAEAAGHPSPDRLQGFLAKAAWDADELRDRVRAHAVAALAADDAVLIADETGDIKKGTKTAGVQRQYTGTAGRIENAQVSVHLSYGSRRGRTLIDAELYLGKHWAGATAEHERRCAEQGVPPERASAVATKPELARRMLERALAASVPFTYFLADEAYGQCRALRAWLEEHQVRYVLAIPKDEVLPLPDGRTRQARELWALVPEDAFERRSCADGAKGPREYDWAAVQLASVSTGLERHLLIRRSTVPNKKDRKTGALVREIAYFLCHTHPGATVAELVVAAGQRWMVEESFQVAKGQVGLDEHEVRKWCSWYRHTTVCMLAMAFLVTVRSRLIPAPPTTPDPRP